MKKLVISTATLLLAACQNNTHNGRYVNYTGGQYALTDDTLDVRGRSIISRSGFQKMRNGQLMPKEFKTRQVFELHPVFENNQLILNHHLPENQLT
jgi:hypothetical protein